MGMLTLQSSYFYPRAFSLFARILELVPTTNSELGVGARNRVCFSIEEFLPNYGSIEQYCVSLLCMQVCTVVGTRFILLLLCNHFIIITIIIFFVVIIAQEANSAFRMHGMSLHEFLQTRSCSRLRSFLRTFSSTLSAQQGCDDKVR